MKVKATEVRQVTVTIVIDGDQAHALNDGLSYYNSCVGGNNFNMGYKAEEPSTKKAHVAMVALQRALAKELDETEEGRW